MKEININNYLINLNKEFFYCDFSDEDNVIQPTKVKISRAVKQAMFFTPNDAHSNVDEFDDTYYYFNVTSLDGEKVYWTNQDKSNFQGNSVKLCESLEDCVKQFKKQITSFYENNKKVFEIEDFDPLFDKSSKLPNRLQLVEMFNKLNDEQIQNKIKEKISEFCN